MFIVGMLTWWYTSGWKKLVEICLQRLAITEDYFSIDQLLGSLFAPFKQISATSGSGGNLQMKLQAWFDKQFSRVVGAVVRSLIILVGVIWILIQSIFYIALFLLWPLLPVAPLIGLILAIGGYLP